MDKYIRVKNCNCISDATIEIVEKSLNIKYGSNGTGKSTISEAIYAQANNETDRLKDFKPYGSNDNSQPTVDNPYFHVVKVFNEDYVNSYLFQGDEFLDDSFQVFLKSDKCDSLAAQIERMLEELQDLINNIDAIHNLRTFLPQYTAAVKASDGTVSRRGGVAEFVNGNGGGFNHYSELKAYKPFYSRDLPSVAKWAKWRNDGIKQMCGNDCPFCTNILPSSIRSQNEIISKVFKNSALSVANAVLEYVQQAVDQGYILPDAVDVLESYIGDNTKADELYAELQMLAKETDYLYKKIEKICMFKPMNVTHAQLVNLEQSLSELVIEVIDTRTKKSVTIQNEILRSHQEVEIANFLYLNNIEYEYEPIYQYNIQYSHKPYTPDFVIYQNGKIAYIEHFGITENGKNDRYSQDELEQYKKAINDKIKLHKQHDTTLIYTFSVYNDGKPLTEHLQEALEVKGFELKPRSNKEVMELLVAGEENRYVRKLINLICRFISNFKVNGYNAEEFNRMYHSTQNVRSRLFLEICHDCYLEYDRWLKENKAVDFEDMINESARLLREVKEMKQKLSFKYIIVDEYQDISRQRFDLTKALSEVTDAKIIAVGDDWQSIYAFSGSDITLFTKFSEKMGYAKMLKIVKTYRNSQEVIDIAGNFIQKNSEQIRKRLLSPKNITDPVIIYTYDSTAKGRKGDRRSGSNYAVAHAVETALTQLIMYKKQEGRQPGTILLLGRYAFDGDHLEKSGLFEFVRGGSKIKSVKYPKLDITFMTAHSSKGLGYDDVIIVNGKNETYGFPSKIEDDPVLAFVIKGDRSIDYAEERRLFYVAMTRTKNRVFFVAPEQNPSEFLLELKKDYKNVVLHGNWNEEKPQSIAKKSCPLCGYPMQLKYKRAYGLRLYICTNEPEICGFMTNDYRAGKLCIQKCDKCRDGYLVVKSSKENGYFLGCTNYKTNGTGCNKSIGMKYYYDQMGYRMEIVTESPVAISRIEKENPVKRVAVTQVSTDDYVEIEKTTAASVRYKRWILNNVVDTVLRALQDVSKVRYYGVTMLTDILRGANSKRILDNGLEMVPEYGMLKEIPRETIQNIIEWLINEHYILKTKEKYPVLHSTYEGLHYSESLTKTKLEELKAYLEKDEA